MSVQDLYFATMARICGAMAGYSDPDIAAAFGRVGRTLALLGLRSHGTDGITIDRMGSGLPILKEAASLALDRSEGIDTQDDPDALRRQMLDFMMTRRRRPPVELSGRMARAVYARALRGPEPAFACEPTSTTIVRSLDRFPVAATWDFWDGVASIPVHVRCAFERVGDCDGPETDRSLCDVARLFSGQAFPALSLAHEIDERLPNLRLRSLSKLAIGPFCSDVFTDTDDALTGFLRQIDDVADAWVMGWTVDEVRSGGRLTRRSGLLGLSSRPYERLAAEPQDLHMLVPHAVYQLLSDDATGRAMLASRRIHVVTGSSLTQDV